MNLTIGGLLTLDALAKLHRPADQDAMRTAALDLQHRGLKAADIARALDITTQAVEQLLGTAAATCQRTGVPAQHCTCIGPHEVGT